MRDGPIELPTWRSVSEQDFNTLIETIEQYEDTLVKASRELERLHAVETAALKVLETMGHRHSDIHGRVVPSGFTMSTMEAVIALDDTLQQDEEDDGE
jgi:hypothetical protein